MTDENHIITCILLHVYHNIIVFVVGRGAVVPPWLHNVNSIMCIICNSICSLHTLDYIIYLLVTGQNPLRSKPPRSKPPRSKPPRSKPPPVKTPSVKTHPVKTPSGQNPSLEKIIELLEITKNSYLHMIQFKCIDFHLILEPSVNAYVI